MKLKMFSLVVSCLVLMMITGCASYYKITDPTSRIVYYTKSYDTKGGSIAFKDARTGAMVTIQNSEIKEISRQTFDEEVKK